MFEIPRQPTTPETASRPPSVPGANPERPELRHLRADTGYVRHEPDAFTPPAVADYQRLHILRPSREQTDTPTPPATADHQRPDILRPSRHQTDTPTPPATADHQHPDILRPSQHQTDTEIDLERASPRNEEGDVMPEAQASDGDLSEELRGAAGKVGTQPRSTRLPSPPAVVARRRAPTDRPETAQRDTPAPPRPVDATPEDRPAPDSEVVGAISPIELPPGPNGHSDGVGGAENDEQPEPGKARGVVVPIDRLTGHFVDVGMSGLESSLWKVGEELADRLHSVGPQVVRGLYLTKQVVEMFKGHQSGDGFYFKVSAPGLDLPSGWSSSSGSASGACTATRRVMGSERKSRSSSRGSPIWT
ncbi:hypothetical protein C8E87_7168 [Paractinoplanes brasiliensis]|uniref:Uncharacterized protein n=1 Tax=Paractinoplanes brasiliensis TaxID=52695 RepID=A0A4V3C5Z3_9ACTN|nr:hypothetical protein C8E87_7168 [Actinoplanes brasiliensis]